MLVSLLLFVAVAVADLAPLLEVESAIAGEYIVVYKDDIKLEELKQEFHHAISNFEVMHQYRHALNGYAARLTKAQLTEVRANPLVKFVEPNGQVFALDTECSDPVSVDSWGLTRISQVKMNLNGKYNYPTTAGKGVVAYVIDTGIYVDNVEFEGRATFGFKAEPGWSSTDGNGHGTHVTSTILGKSFGVAREATAVGVKVLGDNGSGTYAGVVAGIEWSIQEHKSKKQNSVINMSLGGGFSAVINGAVNAAVAEGFVVAVAAGNDDNDACKSSPSSAEDVISVGATYYAADQKDIRAYFSNWGTCVDIFAPGQEITGAWIGSPTATKTISGTSMASPHIAGLAALYWSENLDATNEEIKAQIHGNATPNVIDLKCRTSACEQSPNLLAYNNC